MEHDLRLTTARKLRWDKNAWRQQGYLALVLRNLRQIVGDASESTEARAEAEMLIRALNLAGKRPV